MPNKEDNSVEGMGRMLFALLELLLNNVGSAYIHISAFKDFNVSLSQEAIKQFWFSGLPEQFKLAYIIFLGVSSILDFLGFCERLDGQVSAKKFSMPFFFIPYKLTAVINMAYIVKQMVESYAEIDLSYGNSTAYFLLTILSVGVMKILGSMCALCFQGYIGDTSNTNMQLTQ